MSAKALDSNEHPVNVRPKEGKLIVELPRLAAAVGFVTIEISYADMKQDSFRLSAPGSLGCADGAYDFIEASQLQPDRITPPSVVFLFGMILIVGGVTGVILRAWWRLKF